MKSLSTTAGVLIGSLALGALGYGVARQGERYLQSPASQAARAAPGELAWLKGRRGALETQLGSLASQNDQLLFEYTSAHPLATRPEGVDPAFKAKLDATNIRYNAASRELNALYHTIDSKEKQRIRDVSGHIAVFGGYGALVVGAVGSLLSLGSLATQYSSRRRTETSLS